MKHLNGLYTQQFNTIHGRDGALFRGRYTISTITVMEIFHKVQRESAISRLLGTISEAEVLTLDVRRAELAGRIYADLELTGQPIGRADPMVAGIALRYDIVLFQCVRGKQRIKRILAEFCTMATLASLTGGSNGYFVEGHHFTYSCPCKTHGTL